MGKRKKIAERVTTLMDKPEFIRNIGIVAHIDHGKTTLSDNLLGGAGMISMDLAGKQLFMDFDPLEQARGITIDAANVSMVHEVDGKEYLINMIDTPGHVDFGGDVTRAMRAVDGAVVVVDAVEGAMPQTETVLRQALKEGVRPVLFVNKVDRMINELKVEKKDMAARLGKVIDNVNKLILGMDEEKYKAGWKLDAQGNLHPQEKYLIETLVNQFRHHTNLIWALEESCNKISRAKQQRLKKIAELIARTDNFHHPIAQMFQVLYYDEVHPDKVGPEDYANDPYVKVMTWGHYSKAKGLPPVEQYYRELVGHGQQAAGRYVLLNTEVDKHPTVGAASRLYSWTSAMANMYAANAYHRPDKTNVPRETFQDDSRIRAFLEGTDFHRMSPQSDLKNGSTLYVLASDAGSYIAYSNNATRDMGVRNLQAGTYLLRWFDTANGNTVEQVAAVATSDQVWPKPSAIGAEAALYVKRLDGVVAPELK